MIEDACRRIKYIYFIIKDYFSFISLRNKFVLVHIGKTGGTSLHSVVLELSHLSEKETNIPNSQSAANSQEFITKVETENEVMV